VSGPVWRYESERHGVCGVCLEERHGLFVEGEVVDNEFRVTTCVCPDCYRRDTRVVVSGEAGRHAPAPAYAHR